MKKGEIWISAVIYIGLGVIAITLLVGAGVPLLNKMRDRNAFLQTKEVMQIIDNSIRDVASEGPGSQRYLSPLEINKGYIEIPKSSNTIIWTMETKAVLQEPGVSITDGNLELLLKEDSLIKDLYIAEIGLRGYTGDNIIIYVNGNPDGEVLGLNGKFAMTIKNNGIQIGNTVVDIAAT